MTSYMHVSHFMNNKRDSFRYIFKSTSPFGACLLVSDFQRNSEYSLKKDIV